MPVPFLMAIKGLPASFRWAEKPLAIRLRCLPTIQIPRGGGGGCLENMNSLTWAWCELERRSLEYQGDVDDSLA